MSNVAIDLTKTVKEIITTMKTVIDDIQDNYQTGDGTALLGGKEVVKNTGTWGINISGTATKATQDGDGNVITDTYATKTELNSKTVDLSNYYTKTQVDSAISNAIASITDGDNKSY